MNISIFFGTPHQDSPSLYVLICLSPWLLFIHIFRNGNGSGRIEMGAEQIENEKNHHGERFKLYMQI